MQNGRHPSGKSLERQLIDAAVAGDLPAVRRLLEEGAEAEVSRQDFDALACTLSEEERRRHSDVFTLISWHSGQNRLNAAMYLAAFHGYGEIVDHFLAKSARDPMALKVAVFGAARAGHAALAERLIDAGAEADFKNDYPLRQSIAGGHAETAKMLAARTGAQSRAAGYAIATGNTALAADFLTPDTDVAVVLEQIALALGDAQTPPPGAPRRRDEAGILAGFQMILGFAEARGDDMQQVMMTAAKAAAGHQALPLINDIRWQQTLQDIPDKQAVLSAMLLEDLPPNTRMADYSDAMVRLIEDGADAEKGLMIGIRQCDEPMVDTALRRKVDPRRRRGRALVLARHMADKAVSAEMPAQSILGSIMAVTAMMTVMDETAHQDGLTAANPLDIWRQVDPATGKTGLMSVFSIGKVADYLSALQKQGEDLPLADLLHRDAKGYRALDCIDDARQLDKLFAPALWQNRHADYAVFWQALTPRQQAEQQNRHAEIMQRRQSAEGRQRVSDLARRHRGRFKL